MYICIYKYIYAQCIPVTTSTLLLPKHWEGTLSVFLFDDIYVDMYLYIHI